MIYKIKNAASTPITGKYLFRRRLNQPAPSLEALMQMKYAIAIEG